MDSVFMKGVAEMGQTLGLNFYDPDLFLVVGDPGVGKTTLLNGMADYRGEAGDDAFEGVTSWDQVRIGEGPVLKNGKKSRVCDTPGLGGPKGKLTEWLANLFDILGKQAKHIAGIVIFIDGLVPRIQMSSHIMTQVVPALLNKDGNPWDRICIVVSKCNMEKSFYQKIGEKGVKEKLKKGLKEANCPRLDSFDENRDIIMCGLKGEAPAYDALIRRLSLMVEDKTIPQFEEKKQAVAVVQKAIVEAMGPTIDGIPVSAVASNMVEECAALSKTNCGKCCTVL